MSLRPNALVALLASFIFTLGAPAPALAQLRAGPMVGDVDAHNASIWVQSERQAQIVLRYWPADQPTTKPDKPIEVRTQTTGPDALATFRLTELKAGQRYFYSVAVAGYQGQTFEFTTQSVWRPRSGSQPSDLRVALGSCAYSADASDSGSAYAGDPRIFEHMASYKPQLTLWLGDNLYLREDEYSSPEGIMSRYRQDRAQPALQRLLQTGRHAAIWDDHDYGPNDSNSSYVLKQASLEVFKRYWPNRSFGLPETPGVFTQFSEGDVDFFLLDNRTYRDSDKDLHSPSKQMFGPAQIRWLKNALLNSTATFKLVAAGGQFLNDFNRFEGWTNFKAERDDFLAWLKANRVSGVVFLSGDRHHTELIQLPREGSYPLFELTCSPLTAGVAKLPDEDKKPYLIPGTLVQQRNFCGIEVTGPRGARLLTLKSFTSEGAQIWSHALEERALR